LLLDRYLMEAAKVQQKVPSPDLVSQLARLSNNEIASTKTVLAVMDARAEITNFSTALATYSNLEQVTAFPQVRRIVAETMIRLAPDGYTLKPPSWTAIRTPEEMVREMVEGSSLELAAIGAIATRASSAASPAPNAERSAPVIP